MSQLSEQIRVLVDRFPGSFSELARSTGIDRSTLYKITGGKRLPTQRQLQSLLDVGRATQQQRLEIGEAYRLCTTDAAAQERSAHLQALLQNLLHVTSPSSFPVLHDAAPGPSALLTEPAAIRTALYTALQQYLAGPSTLPVLLSPQPPAVVRDCILQAFAAAPAPHEVWQLTALAPRSSDAGFYASLSALSGSLPYLYAEHLNYRGHLVFEDAAPAQRPDVLLPHYMLLPDRAFLLDADGTALYILADRTAAEQLRLRFTQEFLRAEPYLLQESADAAPAEIIAQVGGMPPDDDLPALCYTTEAALLAYARTDALPAAQRRKVLTALHRRCADGALFRLTAPELFPVDAGLSLTITAGRQLQVQRQAADGSRRYDLQDKDLADALLQHLRSLDNTPCLHTKRYTLDFLQCCVNAVEG